MGELYGHFSVEWRTVDYVFSTLSLIYYETI